MKARKSAAVRRPKRHWIAALPRILTSSQNFEDVLLRRALQDIQSGFYVDIGAWHPHHDSVSHWFYENGWHGINVEPNPSAFELLVSERPRDTNLQLAIAGKRRSVTLFMRDGMSTIQPAVALGYSKMGIDIGSSIRVDAITLEELFEKYVGETPVDFLKIDVEGSEAEILRKTSFDRVRPRIIVVEATEPGSPVPSWKDWERYLVRQDYQRAWFDGLNCFYLRKEDRWRRGFFDAPPNVFDSIAFSVGDPRVEGGANLLVELSDVRADLHELQQSLSFKDIEISRLASEEEKRLFDIGKVNVEKTELEGRVRALRADFDAMQFVASHVRRENEALRSENLKLTYEAKLQHESYDKLREVSAAEGAELREHLELLQAEKRQALDTRESLETELGRLRDAVTLEQQERSRQQEVSRAEGAELREHLELLQAEKRQALDARESLEAELARLREAVIFERQDRSREHAAMEAERAELRGQVEFLTAEKHQVNVEQQALIGERDRLLGVIRSEQHQKIEQDEEVQIEKRRLEGRIADLSDEKEKISGQLRQTEDELHRLQRVIADEQAESVRHNDYFEIERNELQSRIEFLLSDNREIHTEKLRLKEDYERLLGTVQVEREERKLEQDANETALSRREEDVAFLMIDRDRSRTQGSLWRAERRRLWAEHQNLLAQRQYLVQENEMQRAKLEEHERNDSNLIDEKRDSERTTFVDCHLVDYSPEQAAPEDSMKSASSEPLIVAKHLYPLQSRLFKSRMTRWLARGIRRHSDMLTAIADRARDQSHWGLAAIFYRQALDLDDFNAPIWVQYGHALKEMGHVTAGENAYRVALCIEADSSDTHLQLGHVLKLQGRFVEALAEYARALELDATSVHASSELRDLKTRMPALVRDTQWR
jgi:FkbM family methyltransferase